MPYPCVCTVMCLDCWDIDDGVWNLFVGGNVRLDLPVPTKEMVYVMDFVEMWNIHHPRKKIGCHQELLNNIDSGIITDEKLIQSEKTVTEYFRNCRHLEGMGFVREGNPDVVS